MADESRADEHATAAQRLQVLALHALPHHLLSGIMLAATRIRFRPWKNWQIRWFIRRYGVDMGLAMVADPEAYPEFNSFFTRALKPGARPVCEDPRGMACPADGIVSQAGTVTRDTLLQAKGQSYSLRRLLAADEALAARFEGGPYATIYLSPRDYHRVHMPLSGRLLRMTHVPGRLYSVNPVSTRTVPGLFTSNERVVSIFETELGLLAMVLVGAVFVGGIEQVWCGALGAAAFGRPRVTEFDAAGRAPVTLRKGEEMGRFNMGSTVIFALANPQMGWKPHLLSGTPVVTGECVSSPSTARL